MYFMSRIRRFDVGITVADLDTVTAFFVGLGLEVEGRMFIEGEFADTVVGIPGSRSHIVMLRPPEEGRGLSFRASSGRNTSLGRPPPWPTSWGFATCPSTSLGIRPIGTFTV
jgi:catechol 2,3-dioxygenase-like lactoylglutathione lyase family enzyme